VHEPPVHAARAAKQNELLHTLMQRLQIGAHAVMKSIIATHASHILRARVIADSCSASHADCSCAGVMLVSSSTTLAVQDQAADQCALQHAFVHQGDGTLCNQVVV
jgi:hypothetical protein